MTAKVSTTATPISRSKVMPYPDVFLKFLDKKPPLSDMQEKQYNF